LRSVGLVVYARERIFRFFLKGEGAMRILSDLTGIRYQLLDEQNGRVRLQLESAGRFSQTYSREFIEMAIRDGILKEEMEAPDEKENAL